MRLANDKDQEIIRSALPDSSTSTTSFLSSIGNGEAIAFGEAVAVPMRMRFERVQETLLPQAHAGVEDDDREGNLDLRTIVQRMRHSNRSDEDGAHEVPIADANIVGVQVGEETTINPGRADFSETQMPRMDSDPTTPSRRLEDGERRQNPDQGRLSHDVFKTEDDGHAATARSLYSEHRDESSNPSSDTKFPGGIRAALLKRNSPLLKK